MKGRIGREQLGLIFGLPVLILVIFGAWVIWRQTADLDPIEARQLDWSALRKLGWEHIKVTFVATFFVLATALPIGVALTRPKLRRFSGPVVAFANAGQATPVIGLIVLLALWIGFTFWVAVLALAIYAFLPVLRNTIVGLQQVDPTLVEAARGVGMTSFETLRKVELPLAVPVIMTGVRTSLVLITGTASLACFINAGGLGEVLQTGISLFRFSLMITGALLIALLALLIEWVGRLLEIAYRPKGV